MTCEIIKEETTFRKTRNCQANHQAILLALINRHFSITLVSPKKKSNAAQQILTIQSIQMGEDTICVEEFLTKRLREISSRDVNSGVSQKTANRRFENNRIAEGNNLLIDILKELGYSFTSKLTNGKSGTIKNETISTIHYGGKQIMNATQINFYGKLLNVSLNSVLSNNKSLHFEQNDQSFQKFTVFD